MAVQHIHRAFKTLQSPATSPVPPPSLNCSLAIVAFNTTCPGFTQKFGSRGFFNGFCPCFTLARQKEPVYQAMLNECDAIFVFSFQMTSVALCSQPAKKDKYCGEDFMNINSSMPLISMALENVTTDSGRLALQRTLGALLCTECFDQIVAGTYRYNGLLQAYTESPKCNTPECRASAQSMSETFSSVQMLSSYCAKNDNVQQVSAGDTYCLPWFMYVSKGGPGLAKCKAITTAIACTPAATNRDCFFLNGTCYSSSDPSIPKQSGEYRASGDSYLRDMCSNTCSSRSSMAGDLCLSNKNGFCMSQTTVLVLTSICASDMATWESSAPTCSDACAAGVKTYVDTLGCCYGSSIASENKTLKSALTVCKVVSQAPCDSYASAPVPITTKVSGNCVWLNMNGPVNTEYLLNETAKSMGLTTSALRGFVVTSVSGVSCTNDPSSTLGLVESFSIVASDDATAQRIAAWGNSNSFGITLVAVEKAAMKAITLIQLSGTDPPRIVNTPSSPLDSFLFFVFGAIIVTMVVAVGVWFWCCRAPRQPQEDLNIQRTEQDMNYREMFETKPKATRRRSLSTPVPRSQPPALPSPQPRRGRVNALLLPPPVIERPHADFFLGPKVKPGLSSNTLNTLRMKALAAKRFTSERAAAEAKTRDALDEIVSTLLPDPFADALTQTLNTRRAVAGTRRTLPAADKLEDLDL